MWIAVGYLAPFISIPPTGGENAKPQPSQTATEIQQRLAALKAQIMELDELIAPIAREAADVGSTHWGPLLRAGNDKSHLARQVEASADIYTSRVSNFLYTTPFAYLRSGRGSMPHDPSVTPLP